jgi:hypothetical protein
MTPASSSEPAISGGRVPARLPIAAPFAPLPLTPPSRARAPAAQEGGAPGLDVRRRHGRAGGPEEARGGAPAGQAGAADLAAGRRARGEHHAAGVRQRRRAAAVAERELAAAEQRPAVHDQAPGAGAAQAGALRAAGAAPPRPLLAALLVERRARASAQSWDSPPQQRQPGAVLAVARSRSPLPPPWPPPWPPPAACRCARTRCRCRRSSGRCRR